MFSMQREESQVNAEPDTVFCRVGTAQRSCVVGGADRDGREQEGRLANNGQRSGKFGPFVKRNRQRRDGYAVKRLSSCQQSDDPGGGILFQRRGVRRWALDSLFGATNAKGQSIRIKVDKR